MTELQALQALSAKLSTIGIDLLDFVPLDIPVEEALALDNASSVRLINEKRGIFAKFAQQVNERNMEGNEHWVATKVIDV